MDKKEELKQHEVCFESTEENIKELQHRLADWLDGHPTFREELSFFDESPERDLPAIKSARLDHLDAFDEIEDEWDFVFKYGFLEGLMEANTSIDTKTGVPYDEIEADEG